MPKAGPNKRKRAPRLSFTVTQGIGWHVSFRDATTGSPTRHRFGIREKRREPEARIRNPGEPRRQGTIVKAVYKDRRKHITDFLDFLNERHGERVTSRMKIADLSMADVEGFNQWAVGEGYSASQVNKRMQMVKGIIDRAGRPEHGGQVLSWNWDSRDLAHGKPSEARTLPKRHQLRCVLAACELRERTMVWMAIGLGFGQQDLANVRAGQIDQESYDLRRSKTGIERFGITPPYRIIRFPRAS